MALAIGAGTLVVAASRRLRVPALLPLLGTGLLLGTAGIGVVDGAALGDGLRAFVNIAIGLLIFEGALHLNHEELARAPRAVWGLLTVGALSTWLLSAIAAHWLLGFSTPVAILLGAALIVTGPTVVQPLLRVLRVSPRVQAVLSAEAVLIDPLGVLATVTALEVMRQWLTLGPESATVYATLWLLGRPILVGGAIGIATGAAGYGLMTLATRHSKADPQSTNLIALGVCMAAVGVGEAVTAESGLVAATVCGIVMARARVLGVTELRSFKEHIAVVLVGTLFILLASRINIAALASIGTSELWFVACLLLVVRPLSVLASTTTSRLTWRERLFVGTFAPRGIVALSVAAIVAQELRDALAADSVAVAPAMLGHMAVDVERLETIMFTVIAVTVAAASFGSPLLARVLQLRDTGSRAALLVGAHSLAQLVAARLQREGVTVRLVDRNADRVRACVAHGLDAVAGDATDTRWLDDFGAPIGLGAVIAWTGNNDVDQIVARWAMDRVGVARTGIWSSQSPNAPATQCVLGSGPIQAAIDACSDDRLEVCVVPHPSAADHTVGTLVGGAFAPGKRSTASAPGRIRWVVVGPKVDRERPG